uniref:winged helix-turn-helix domain-containing protein n=1 Tax=Scandinavium sp. TaxID=2830653 RepID=UPI0028A201C7
MNKRYGSVNNWLIDLPSGSILHLVTGERKRLGEYQLKLLDVLMQDAGKIFTREELTNLVWDRRVIGNNSLPNAIHALRAALEDDGKKQKIIKTIPRKGYVLEPEYCSFVEKDEAEVNEAEPAPEPLDVIDETAPTVIDEGEKEIKLVAPPDIEQTDVQPASRAQRYLLLALILLIV